MPSIETGLLALGVSVVLAFLGQAGALVWHISALKESNRTAKEDRAAIRAEADRDRADARAIATADRVETRWLVDRHEAQSVENWRQINITLARIDKETRANGNKLDVHLKAHNGDERT
jgi:Na+-transporting methylmalonyl-CoA/oxaloacetate decarboxylase gamma subunit